MKKVDNFVFTWWLIGAITGSVMSATGISLVAELLAKQHRSFIDALCIMGMSCVFVMTIINCVIAGSIVAHNCIVDANAVEESK